MRTRGVVVDDIDAVIDALEQFRQGGDLADVGGSGSVGWRTTSRSLGWSSD
jgi:hypothetical protein